MCGIAGIIGKNTKYKDVLIREMTERIIHRGPDEDGFYDDEYVGLGMRRLSIIDLGGGKQPIVSADGSKLIFFNGEIYNYKKLRAELEQKGYQFKTNTDTEVILHYYELEGEKMLTRLRGMFAFCIYDKNTHSVFIARDYFGIKPLYYLKPNNEILAFGSEIKSLLKHPAYSPEVNNQAVYNYLSFQYNPLKETMFQGIYKLLPGSWLSIDLETGKSKEEKYWSYEFVKDGSLDEKQTKEKIKEVMEDSVRHHMIADVPVASFLSGGIDSSIIATLMQKISGEMDNPQKISTFTVGFKNLSEGEEAKVTADAIGSDHHEIIITPEEYFQMLPKLAWHFDEPVADPSAIALYFVAREAAKHAKVVLSGEGSDELFGGYNIYLEPYARRNLNMLPKFIREYIFRPILKIPFEFKGKNYLRRCFTPMEQWYIGNASIFKPDEIKELWQGSQEALIDLKPVYSQIENLSESAKMQYIDINYWMPGDILAKADKMTMANSLELRVPFLDIEVANLARRLPDSFKWRNGETKYLLREAMKSIIPEATRTRKKLGFPTPLRAWLTSEREDIYSTIKNNEYIKKNLDLTTIERLIDEHISKKRDNSRKIYILLMLALWYNVFFEKTS
ncbi:MAG: asparagine synthase (glutamine-hydrolyzing) [Candidatus Paceibacterota bacterium]|jgi:asparagine synthase (glutamine-hydrolysing)